MGSRFAGFYTASLIDGHIDQHGSLFHGPEHLPRDQFRSFSAGNQYRTHDHISFFDQPTNRPGSRHEQETIAWHDIVQIPEPLQVVVQQIHLGA